MSRAVDVVGSSRGQWTLWAVDVAVVNVAAANAGSESRGATASKRNSVRLQVKEIAGARLQVRETMRKLLVPVAAYTVRIYRFLI